MRVAEAGIAELRKAVDALIVVPNQNLFRVSRRQREHDLRRGFRDGGSGALLGHLLHF
jgi:hypothetical protein